MSDAWPTGTLIAGKFRVVRVLGEGGMGVVYEVIHELTRHRRALKTLHAKHRQHPNAVQRFLREASAAGRIGSPFIVETFDAGELDSGEPYLVMELCDGETLDARLARKGRLDPREIVSIFRQAAEGVHAAHEAGIIHRDLKPENVFLAKTHEGMRVKLLDFGVSIFDERHRLDRSTQEGTLVGTPFYMSPEQVRGAKILDARSDVYALGIMMHEAAVGEHPYPAEAVPAIIANVIEKLPAPLVDLVPGFPSGLSSLVARAVVKDREERLPTARALAQGLDACARELGGPVSIAPASMAKTELGALSNAPMSGVGAASLAPNLSRSSPAASVALPPLTSSEPSVEVAREPAPPPAARRSLVLSLLGAVVGAGLVGVALIAILAKASTKPQAPNPARDAEAASLSARPEPAVSPAPPSSAVAVEPRADAKPATSATPADTSTASAAGPPKPAITAAPRSTRAAGGPHDLATKGEFKP